MGLHQIRWFYMALDLVKIKDSPINGRKNIISDKGIISKTYETLTKLSNKKKQTNQKFKETNNAIQNWIEAMNRCFHEEDIWMASSHMKKCSSPFIR